MKKSKLMSCIAALAIAMVLGSCSDEEKVDKKDVIKNPVKQEQSDDKNDSGNKADDSDKKDDSDQKDESAKTEIQKNHVFICFGQSNMEGNAPIKAGDNDVDPRFQCYVTFAGNYDGKAYNVGDVRKATPPLCRAGQFGGIGVTDWFGRTMVEYLPEDEKVTVVVVAIGGTSIKGFIADEKDSYIAGEADWLQNTYKLYENDPYSRLIQVAEIAKTQGTIEAILMHQGESDWQNPNWANQVKTVYDNIIEDLDIEQVPFLVGQTTGTMQMIADLPKTIKTAHVINSDGCSNDKANENGAYGATENGIHFNHAGYEELGTRYAYKMLDLMGIVH